MSRGEPPDSGKKCQLTQENLDRLLAWLDPDRERAGTELDKISAKLTNMFARRPNCQIPDELAHEVICRVAKKLPEVEATYVGEKAVYFYGFVEYVYQEYLRDCKREEEAKSKLLRQPPPSPDPSYLKERNEQCLKECSKKLKPEEYLLLMRYYKDQGKAKIDSHKALADELGITLNTLRTRVHRLKAIVEDCVRKCVDEDEKRRIW
jgi:DNA-directed RNA polymerase specialized sigma24 family protein